MINQDKEYRIKKSKDADVTADFLALYDESVPEISSDLEKKLSSKVSWIVVSLVTAINFVFFFDKITMSYSAFFEFWKDTNLDQTRYSNANSLYYVGYIIGQTNLIFVQKYSIKKCFTILSALWTIIMFLSCLLSSYQGVYLVRFFLGYVESTAFTMMHMTMSQFLTLEEKSATSNLWCIGCLGSTIPVGFIAFGVLHITKPAIALWKIFTLIISGCTFLVTLIIAWIYPSNPTDARFLSIDEKVWVIRRVQRSTKSSIEQRTLKMYQVKECLVDPVTWLFGFGMFFLMLCNNLWYQSNMLYVSVGATSDLNSTLVSTAVGGFTVVCGFVAYYLMHFFPKIFTNTVSLLFWTLPCLISSIVMVALPWHFDKKIFIAMIAIAQIYGIPWIQLISFSQQTVSGYTKVLTRQGVVMVFYAIANIISPQLWRKNDGPRYYTAWIVQIVLSFGLMPLLVVLIWYILKRRNSVKLARLAVDERSDLKHSSVSTSSSTHSAGMEHSNKMGIVEKEDGTTLKVNVAALDLTDIENDLFMYPL